MDESSVQCVKEVRDPIPMQPGHSERYDVEYERNGVAHLLLFYAPFENWRRVDVTNNHAAGQWAAGIRRSVQDDYPEAQRMTLVMDNLNTHTGASLYQTFAPAIARSLLDKLEFVYTPKHGVDPTWPNVSSVSWLDNVWTDGYRNSYPSTPNRRLEDRLRSRALTHRSQGPSEPDRSHCQDARGYDHR